MKKVDNLKKALAQIDAKAARLAFARSKILARLEELEAVRHPIEGGSTKRQIQSDARADLTELHIVEETLKAEGQLETVAEGLIGADALLAYMAGKQFRHPATEKILKQLESTLRTRQNVPTDKVVRNFVTYVWNKVPVRRGDERLHQDLNEVEEACFGLTHLERGSPS